MKEVQANLFVGDLNDCLPSSNFKIVHVCKDPCHRRAVGYAGNLPPQHPNYLIKKTNSALYLNLVDAPRILPKFTDGPILEACGFITANLAEGHKVLIHCNLGKSRSCAIAVVYLAKEKIISNNSYNDALNDFKLVYPDVDIGIGFTNYLTQNWSKLIGGVN